MTVLICILNIKNLSQIYTKIFPKEYLAKIVIGQFAKNEKKILTIERYIKYIWFIKITSMGYFAYQVSKVIFHSQHPLWLQNDTTLLIREKK